MRNRPIRCLTLALLTMALALSAGGCQTARGVEHGFKGGLYNTAKRTGYNLDRDVSRTFNELQKFFAIPD